MRFPEPTLRNSIIYWIVIFAFLLLYSGPTFRDRLMRTRPIVWVLKHLDLTLLLAILLILPFLQKG